MVWTFLEGIDPDVTNFASTYLEGVFNRYADALTHDSFGIEEDVMIRIRAQITSDSHALLEKFNEDLEKFKSTNNTQPILDMVGVLPKDELAAMAESW